MTIQARAYRGDEDFHKMMFVLREGRKASRHSGYIHIGDLNWWAFYIIPRRFSVSDLAYLWEDEKGSLLGWSLLSPQEGVFDLFVLPSERNTERRREMLVWTENRMRALYGKEQVSIASVFVDDEVWLGMLLKSGYVLDTEDRAYAYMVHSLENIPEVELPEGFHLRGIQGVEEAEARAEVHAAAWTRPGFQSPMNGERYRYLMTAPSYQKELDIVAVAPSGRFSANAMVWFDSDNAMGHFEPVGTHPDFRRLGLGRAVLGEGLRRLKALGARDATVNPVESDSVAMGLYLSAGFQTINKIVSYTKKG